MYNEALRKWRKRWISEMKNNPFCLSYLKFLHESMKVENTKKKKIQYDILYCICLPCSHAVNISYKHNQPNIKYLPLANILYFILFFCYTFRPTRSSSLSLLSMILDGTQMYLLCVYKEHIKTFLFITYDIYSLFVNFRKLSTPFFTTLCKPCVVE